MCIFGASAKMQILESMALQTPYLISLSLSLWESLKERCGAVFGGGLCRVGVGRLLMCLFVPVGGCFLLRHAMPLHSTGGAPTCHQRRATGRAETPRRSGGGTRAARRSKWGFTPPAKPVRPKRTRARGIAPASHHTAIFAQGRGR